MNIPIDEVITELQAAVEEAQLQATSTCGVMRQAWFCRRNAMVMARDELKQLKIDRARLRLRKFTSAP